MKTNKVVEYLHKQYIEKSDMLDEYKVKLSEAEKNLTKIIEEINWLTDDIKKMEKECDDAFELLKEAEEMANGDERA